MSIQLNQTATGDERETIKNPTRGCGNLDDGKAYLKADMAPGGELPAFVEFDEPIIFKENRKRSYKKFPGIQFELAVTGEGGMTDTTPEGEIHDHLDRLDRGRPTGKHAGEMVEFQAHDLLMSVGATHYETAEQFANEARVHGVSKAINVSSGVEPPEINPGRTRLFLIHPNAVEVTREIETTAGQMQTGDDVLVVDGGDLDASEPADLADDISVTVRRTMQVPGVFGYTYLTRVVYTEDADGNVPEYMKEYEKLGDVDIVKTGREIPYSEQEGFNDDGELTTDAEEALRANYDMPDQPAQAPSLEDYPGLTDEDVKEELIGPEELETQIRDFPPALEPPTIENMEKAPFGELAGEGEVGALRPPEEEDHFRTGEGALAVVVLEDQYYKVMPTHILSVDGEQRTATTQVGPYSVTVTSPMGGKAPRTVEVENTR